MYPAPSAYQNWGVANVLTAAASGPNQLCLNRMAHTGLVQFSHQSTVSGAVVTLQVRHLTTGSFLNWPCVDLATGARYAAGDSITTTNLKTLAFDARDLSDVQLSYTSGAGSYFYWGWSATTAPPIFVQPITHSKSIKSLGGLLTSDTDIVSAVAAKRIKVCAYSLVTSGNTGSLAIFKSGGTGGTELWRVPLKGPDSSSLFGANLAVSAPAFLFGTVAGEKLTLDVDTAAPIYWSIAYYDDDGE